MTEKERAVKYKKIALMWLIMFGGDDAYERYVAWCEEYEQCKYCDCD